MFLQKGMKLKKTVVIVACLKSCSCWSCRESTGVPLHQLMRLTYASHRQVTVSVDKWAGDTGP